ncbi:MAG: T9SS type A sorting domain-containing protein [Calditrichaeota bacterium]|nr:T9SS type A sorting domain-containing protein [Calditrichota bacterium]
MLFHLKNGLLVLFCLFFIFPTESKADILGDIQTDRASYSPGDTVRFRLHLTEAPSGKRLQIDYYFLNKIVDSASFYPADNGYFEWEWSAPENDFRGYLVVISVTDAEETIDRTTIAVDISSDWRRFPRYGFLSDYSYLSQSSIDKTIAELNRFHINGIQFYDWQYKHHLPLKGTPTNPAGAWLDIANRTNYFATVKRYIDAGHRYGMKAMAYNLLYGAYKDAAADGVPTQWRLFKDAYHSNPDYHDLPDSWASDIYLMDPSNEGWKNYIINKMADVFKALPFDGWHIDQLGNRGRLYNYGGREVYLEQTFLPFIVLAKDSLNVSLVMNAVNQYGQQGIAQSPVDFLYTEVWSPNESYADLVSIILNNNSYSDNKLTTTLAAYVNRSLSSKGGYFNPPGVLLTDAVIFAAGGSHLELGEHLLSNEYFPNNNLKMSDGLKKQLIHYYDFLVAYQNLLRDGGEFNRVYLKSKNGISIRSYAQTGSVWNFSKLKDDLQIFHLINFTKANSLKWRDDYGNQPEPDTLINIPVFFTTQKEVKALWFASPDFNGGSVRNIDFRRSGDSVLFEIPYLKYWDMVVADYGAQTALDEEEASYPEKIRFLGNYPNPFNPATRIDFSLNKATDVELSVYNVAGQKIVTLCRQRLSAGRQSFLWNPDSNLPSAVYFAVLKTSDGKKLSHKMLYLK